MLEFYKDYSILIEVEPIKPLPGGQKFCGKLGRLYNLSTKSDESIPSHLHHARTQDEAEKLAMNEVKMLIDQL